MRRPPRRVVLGALALIAALLVSGLGIAGVDAYAEKYDLHRGFNAIEPLRGAGAGRLLTERFHSTAMHAREHYLVYLPPGYTPTRRYPVYYLLHGEPSRPLVFVDVASMDVRLDNLILEGRARPMILVYPDGEIHGNYSSDSEWANTPSGNFESEVMEVVHDVDSRFSTIPNRRGRVIGGFSMGAYGAMNIGLHHLRDFAAIQAWSGYYIETHNGVFAHADPRTMAENSPGRYIVGLRGAIHRDPLDVFMYVGRRDPDAPQQAPMARALREAGAHVGDRVYPGGHDWDVWWPRLNAMIELASFDTSHAPRRTPLPRRPVVPVPDRFGALHPRAARSRGPRHGARRHTSRREAGLIPARPGPPPGTRGSAVRRPRHPTLRLIGALLLTLVAATLINLGFVLQHRGHAAASRRGQSGVRALLRRPSWLVGQLIGWAGWGGQIIAVALVPLTLVQAVAAGSLALSVPLAAWLFGHRVTRAQTTAIVLIGASLACLPIGAGGHGRLGNGLLIGIALALGLGCALACLRRRPAVRALCAGALYGLADAAVKADAIALHRVGPAGLIGGWTILAALATLGGFLAFQTALRDGDAVRPLALMAAFSAITGVVIGATAFHEPLGAGVGWSALHVAGIGVVLLCVPALTRAQQRLAEGPEESGTAIAPATPAQTMPTASEDGSARERGPAADALPASAASIVRVGARGWVRRSGHLLATLCARAAAFLATVLLGAGGIGLLYLLHDAHLLDLGPRVPDALPLLQLAGASAQPLLRVLVASALGGLALGILLARLPPAERMLIVAPTAALLLLVDSDASYALADNLSFLPVLAHTAPGLGPWLQWLLLVGGASLPGLAAGRRAPGARTDPPSPSRALTA